MPKRREGLSEVWEWEIFPIMSGLVGCSRCSHCPSDQVPVSRKSNWLNWRNTSVEEEDWELPQKQQQGLGLASSGSAAEQKPIALLQGDHRQTGGASLGRKALEQLVNGVHEHNAKSPQRLFCLLFNSSHPNHLSAQAGRKKL